MSEEVPLVYNFNPETGEYLGSEPCRSSPLGDGFITYPPGHRSKTHNAPPETKNGTAARWTGDAWEMVEDHRGETVYSTTDGAEIEVRTLGPLPDDVTDEPKPSEMHCYRGGMWVEDEGLKAEQRLAEAQEAAMARVRSAGEPKDFAALASLTLDMAVALGLKEPN